jgi:hypothetical protein
MVVGSRADDNAGFVTCWEFFDWLSNKYILKNYLRLVTVVNDEHGRRRLRTGPHGLYSVKCDEIEDYQYGACIKGMFLFTLKPTTRGKVLVR